MFARWLRLACVVFAVTASSARAQDDTATSPDISPQALYAQAQAAYDAGNWRDALQWLERAYALAPRPAFLFNIGQAQRKLGRCAQARASYDAYLDAVGPDLEAATRVSGAQAALAACVEVNEAPQPTAAVVSPATSPAPPAPSVPRTPTRAEHSPAGADIAAWSLAGGAVVAVAAGSYFAVRAGEASSELERVQRWDAAAAGRESEGRTAATLSRVSFAVGAALAVGALGMYLLGAHSNVDVAAAPGHVEAAVRSRF